MPTDEKPEVDAKALARELVKKTDVRAELCQAVYKGVSLQLSP